MGKTKKPKTIIKLILENIDLFFTDVKTKRKIGTIKGNPLSALKGVWVYR